jgi:hypothetical protein
MDIAGAKTVFGFGRSAQVAIELWGKVGDDGLKKAAYRGG